jgi:hypothetical protein
MNFKKYFLINLKQYLVLYIVSFALFATTAVSTVMSYTMYTSTYVQCVDSVCTPQESYDIFGGLTEGGTFGILGSPFMPMILVLFILMLIMPLFAMGARYSLNASDTYKQVAQKRNAIRLTNNLTLLSAILIVFTIVYWAMAIGLAIRHATFKLPTPEEPYCYYDEYTSSSICSYEAYTKSDINFGAFGIMYPVVLIFAILQYFISYLFVSRANRPINSVFTLIMGELALALLMFTVLRLADTITNIHINEIIAGNPDKANDPHIYDGLIRQVTGTGNASVLFPISFILGYFTPLISGSKSAFESLTNAQTIVLGISLAIFGILAILGIIAMIFEKDPSGEFAGKPESPKPHQEIIFHIGAFAVGMIIPVMLYQYIIAILVLDVFVIVLYYVFLGIMRRNFKINLKNLIPFLSVSVTIVAFGLILFFTIG